MPVSDAGAPRGPEDLITQDASAEIFSFAAKILPICRSITGDAVRESLGEIKSHIALDIREIPSGMQVFGGTAPREWIIRDAYIRPPMA